MNVLKFRSSIGLIGTAVLLSAVSCGKNNNNNGSPSGGGNTSGGGDPLAPTVNLSSALGLLVVDPTQSSKSSNLAAIRSHNKSAKLIGAPLLVVDDIDS